MRNSAIRLVFAMVVLVLGAGMEELLPKFSGAGFPVLLMASLTMAWRRPAVPAMVFAMAAGAMEDAVSGLPVMASISFFPLAALAVRWSGMRLPVAAVAYAGYQVWLGIWGCGLDGLFAWRLVISPPLGLVTAFAAEFLLKTIEGRAALGEEG